MSVVSDFFSKRRSEAYLFNATGKTSAENEKCSRRRSLSAKYQSLCSHFANELRAALDSNQKSTRPVESTTPSSHVQYGATTFHEALIPVTILEPRKSPKAVEETEKIRLRRRPKTPIRRIGQIEGYSDPFIKQNAVALADEYQAPCELRPSMASPPTSPKHSIRSLRKVRRQYNLRRTSVDSDGPKSANMSDEETVVGSECRVRRPRVDSHISLSSCLSSKSSRSITSYYSAATEQDHAEETPDWGHGTPTKSLNFASHCTVNHNLEMQICLDLLKQDLSSAMSRQPPSNSTLALQLWLMIESYEALKQRLQQQQQRQGPAGPRSKELSESTVQVVDHWLEALYSVYNLHCGQLSGTDSATSV